MLLCALFASAMAFPVMIWRSSPDFGDLEVQLEPVSVILIKAPFLKEQHLENYRLDGLLEQMNYQPSQPYIVKSLIDIYDAESGYFTARYKCDSNATFSPPECLSPHGHLMFNFTYSASKDSTKPLGEIVYNYAFVPDKQSDINFEPPPGYTIVDAGKKLNSSNCVRFDHDLTEFWVLSYYILSPAALSTGSGSSIRRTDAIYVSSPWAGCTTPRPWYQPQKIPIC